MIRSRPPAASLSVYFLRSMRSWQTHAPGLSASCAIQSGAMKQVKFASSSGGSS